MGEAEGVKIHDVYMPLYTSKKRYFLITGGRGSLKSSTVHDFVARLTYETGHGVLFTRYTLKSASHSIIPEFEITLNRMGIRSDFKVTQTQVTNLKTGSFIYFSGIKTQSGDQTENLKSIAGITTWIIEEGADFKDENAFDTIDDSVRGAGRQNRVIWIQNPSTREHFIYKRWIEPKNKQIDVQGYNVTVSAMHNVEHIHTTYHLAAELGYLNEEWLNKIYEAKADAEKLPNKYRSKYYLKYIGGWLEKPEGAVFENWEEGAFDTSLPYLYGLDFGFYPDPLAMIKVAVDARLKRIYLKQVAYDTKLSTAQVLQTVRSGCERPNDLVVCDHDLRIHNELKMAGVNVVLAQKGPDSVINDIREMQDYTLIVDPDSPDLKRELNSYVWNDKKASIPVDDNNHLIDGGRYAFRRLMAPKRQGITIVNR